MFQHRVHRSAREHGYDIDRAVESTAAIEAFVDEVVEIFAAETRNQPASTEAPDRDSYVSFAHLYLGPEVARSAGSDRRDLLGLLADHMTPSWRMGFSARQVALPSVIATRSGSDPAAPRCDDAESPTHGLSAAASQSAVES